ncbi:PH domain-containing protein [Lentibacillus sp. N15]|uniref:PH domain-containing protein n=1 Tax=Lentibacillus songyuanensis TaxID=3136161 RepID=UPI0031B9EAEE
MQKVHKKSIVIWMIESIVDKLLLGVILGLALYFLREYDVLRKIIYLTIIYVGLHVLVQLISSPVRYKNRLYMLEEESLFINDGVFILSKTAIPLKKVQHVAVEQTFASRFYDKYSVHIFTAGDDHHIEFINQDDAEQLRDKLISYLKQQKVHLND